MHAVEYLKSPASHPVGPAVAVYGADGYLRHQSVKAVIGQLFPEEDPDSGPTRLTAKQADLRTVFDTLRTVSMWSEKQLVIIEEADDFVTEHRAELEKYLEKPAKKGVLLLELKSFPSNTRLAKKVAATGLPLDCSPLKEGVLPGWLADYAKKQFSKKLDRAAAMQMVELVGTELGLLVQELGKLAVFVGTEPAISTEAVQAVVGGWRLRTTWEMLDAVVAGNPGAAIKMLDKLLEAGQASQMILGAINWMFRPMAQATELARVGMPLTQALEEAGVKPFKIRSAEEYLRRIRHDRASHLGRWLLQTDIDVKGGSQLPERLIVERLLVRLSGR
jgi:DNA polymerase-3 subunit delta